MRTSRTSSALSRVLPQVERREHAERHGQHAHEDAPSSRCRRSPGKMPPSVFDSRGSPERNSQRRLGIDAGPAAERELVGPIGSEDVERREVLLRAVDRRERRRACARPARPPRRAALRPRRTAPCRSARRCSHRPPRARRVDRCAPAARSSSRAHRQPLGLDRGVDRANLVALDLANPVAIGCRLRDQRLQRLPDGIRAARELRLAVDQTHRRADERPVLAPLDVAPPRAAGSGS